MFTSNCLSILLFPSIQKENIWKQWYAEICVWSRSCVYVQQIFRFDVLRCQNWSQFGKRVIQKTTRFGKNQAFYDSWCPELYDWFCFEMLIAGKLRFESRNILKIQLFLQRAKCLAIQSDAVWWIWSSSPKFGLKTFVSIHFFSLLMSSIRVINTLSSPIRVSFQKLIGKILCRSD